MSKMGVMLEEALEQNVIKFKAFLREANGGEPANDDENICGLCIYAGEIDVGEGFYYARPDCPRCPFPDHPLGVVFFRCEYAHFGRPGHMSSVGYEYPEYCQACVEFYETWLKTGEPPKIEEWDDPR